MTWSSPIVLRSRQYVQRQASKGTEAATEYSTEPEMAATLVTDHRYLGRNLHGCPTALDVHHRFQTVKSVQTWKSVRWQQSEKRRDSEQVTRASQATPKIGQTWGNTIRYPFFGLYPRHASRMWVIMTGVLTLYVISVDPQTQKERLAISTWYKLNPRVKFRLRIALPWDRTVDWTRSQLRNTVYARKTEFRLSGTK